MGEGRGKGKREGGGAREGEGAHGRLILFFFSTFTWFRGKGRGNCFGFISKFSSEMWACALT